MIRPQMHLFHCFMNYLPSRHVKNLAYHQVQSISSMHACSILKQAYLRFTQALLGGSPKNCTWHLSFCWKTFCVGWSQTKLGHHGCPSSLAHTMSYNSTCGSSLLFDLPADFRSFMFAFCPLIGVNPWAPSLGEWFFPFSAVSPQTGEEGFLDFGVLVK